MRGDIFLLSSYPCCSCFLFFLCFLKIFLILGGVFLLLGVFSFVFEAFFSLVDGFVRVFCGGYPTIMFLNCLLFQLCYMTAVQELKAFNEWPVTGIKVEDPGLERYVALRPVIVPKTGARYAGSRFHKSKTFIVERLINKVMVTGHKGKKHYMSSGHNTGKANNAYAIVYEALKIIEARTKKNPLEVFVKALENAAPREEIVTIEYGGARYPKAVECAPQRRIDLTLRLFTQGAYQKSFNKKKPVEQTLADEILGAYQLSQSSLAISKKLELERQADSSR